MNLPLRHLDDDQCAALVLGLLGDGERQAAEIHVRNCAACEARLRAHVGADVRARASQRVSAGVPAIGARRPTPRWHVPAAAAAGLFVIAFALSRAPERASTPAPEWLASPGDMVRTRSETPIEDGLRTGLDAYARHDLTGAIAALGSARASGAAEQARRLYLGHALLRSGRAHEAGAWLEQVAMETLPQPWRDQAVASLAAAWRASGQGRRADSLARAWGR